MILTIELFDVIFPFHLLGLNGLIGVIANFPEFKESIGPLTDRLYAVLPAGVETNIPSPMSFFIIILFPTLSSIVMILVGLPLLFAFYHLNIRKKTKIEWLENWEQKLKIEFNSRELLKEHNGYKIYHSKNFYWFKNESFNSIKDVEAHINNNVVSNK